MESVWLLKQFVIRTWAISVTLFINGYIELVVSITITLRTKDLYVFTACFVVLLKRLYLFQFRYVIINVEYD